MRSFLTRPALLACLPGLFAGAAQANASGPVSQQQAALPWSAIGMELLPALQRATDVGPAPADQVLNLTVSMPYAKPAEVQDFVDAVSDPRSPQYRRFLTPEEVGERFGLATGQVEQLVQYLVDNGMGIELVAKNRLSILATCTVAQAERAFGTRIRSYTLTPEHKVEPASFVAYSTPVNLPGSLAGLVIDVSGLETYTRPMPLVTQLTPVLTRGLYGLTTMFGSGFTGAGRVVGISNWDGFRAADYLNYISHFALPTPGGGPGSNINVIPCNGGGLGAGPAAGEGFHNGKFVPVSDESLKGKWSVIVFMPAAFTFNCPTEVEDAADHYAEFQKMGAEVYIVTTDTHFAHKVWHETSPAVGKAKFPLVGDPTHQLTNAFGVHIPEEGLALRGTFVIDPSGTIKTLEIHDNAIARDVKETLRKLKAAQYVAAHPGEVCPAKWNEGSKTIKPSLDLVGKI